MLPAQQFIKSAMAGTSVNGRQAIAVVVQKQNLPTLKRIPPHELNERLDDYLSRVGRYIPAIKSFASILSACEEYLNTFSPLNEVVRGVRMYYMVSNARRVKNESERIFEACEKVLSTRKRSVLKPYISSACVFTLQVTPTLFTALNNELGIYGTYHFMSVFTDIVCDPDENSEEERIYGDMYLFCERMLLLTGLRKYDPNTYELGEFRIGGVNPEGRVEEVKVLAKKIKRYCSGAKPRGGDSV